MPDQGKKSTGRIKRVDVDLNAIGSSIYLHRPDRHVLTVIAAVAFVSRTNQHALLSADEFTSRQP
jgi:hypothetical protein